MPLFSGSKKEKATSEFEQGKTLFDNGSFDDAKIHFDEAHVLYQKQKDEINAQLAEAYSKHSEGLHLSNQEKHLEAMRAFGRANVLFSTINFQAEAKISRQAQAETQMKLATLKAREGEFMESARLYEAAGAVFQTLNLDEEAAKVRARSFVQRAAAVDNDFGKADFLFKAVEEFRKAEEDSSFIEGHAYFYRGRSLVNIRVHDAVDNLSKAAEKYSRAGADKQLERVRELLRDIAQQAKVRPEDFRM